jgi:hypothetical protein
MRVLLQALLAAMASFTLLACAPGVSVVPGAGGASTTSGTSGTSGNSQQPPPSTTNQDEEGSSGGSANAPLVIAGQPATSATVGEEYLFTPSTNGSPGAVAFTVANAPAWASFDPQHGSLAGVPGTGSAGTYPDIVITATDENSSVSLPAFGIVVAGEATGGALGTAQLAWSAPTSNVDGSPLVNLTGYRIVYGTDVAALDHNVLIQSGSTTSYSVTHLTPGTWYFAVQAVTGFGVESAPSNMVTSTIL